MTRSRFFSGSTGLAALLAAGVIVLGSADLAWAGHGGGGGGGGGSNHMSQSRSSGASNHPMGIKQITIHPIISKGGNSGGSKSGGKDHDRKYSGKHDGKDHDRSKHASKDHKRHKGDDDHDKPPTKTTGNTGTPGLPGKPPVVSKPPVEVVVRDHRDPTLPPGYIRLPNGGVGRAPAPTADGPIVRDHRGDSASSTGTPPPAAAPGAPPPAAGPIVRDHRGDAGNAVPVTTTTTVVRDHRGEGAEGAPAAGGVIVRDHRGEGGTTVTQNGKSKGDDGIIGGIKDLGNAIEDVGRAAAGAIPMATAKPPHTGTIQQQ